MDAVMRCMLLVLVVAGLAAAKDAAKKTGTEAGASQASQDLGPDYTLGHISGMSLQNESSFDKQQGAWVNESVTRLRVGIEDLWALDVPMVYHYRKVERKKTSGYSFPGFRLGIHPTAGLIMDGWFAANNLWGSDSGGGRALRSDLFFHYLSDGGAIHQDSRTSPFAYYYGPILGFKQVDLQGKMDATMGEGAEVRSFGASLGAGLAPYFQGWVRFDDTLGSVLDTSGVSHTRSEQTLVAGMDWVNTPVRVGAQVAYNDNSDHPVPTFKGFGDPTSWRVLVHGGAIGGGIRPSGKEVAGNWNGFFSPQMPQGQFDLEDSLFVYPQEDGNDVQVRGSMRYGALDGASLGLDYDVDMGGGVFSSLYLTTCLSNIPVRAKGPSEVSPLEYQLGYLPKAREVRLMMDVLLPGSNAMPSISATELMADGLGSFRSPWDYQRRGWTRNAESRGNFRLRGILGMSSFLFVQSSLSLVDDLRVMAGPLSYHLMDAWIFGMGAGLHGENVLVQLQLSHYAGKVIPEEGVDNYDNRVARFGPVRLFAAANF